jgi:hypothetical protein
MPFGLRATIDAAVLRGGRQKEAAEKTKTMNQIRIHGRSI